MIILITLVNYFFIIYVNNFSIIGMPTINERKMPVVLNKHAPPNKIRLVRFDLIN
jgi:hypothetical protein